MEAARVAALRGHEVLLYEREKILGGLLPLAAFIKGTDYDDVSLALDWYRTQLLKMQNVKISLETDVDARLVRSIAPDVVVLSPGSKWEIPDIPGIRGANVVTTGALKEKARGFIEHLGSGVTSSLSKVYLPIGKRAIVLGGDLKGLEAIEFLVKRGREAILVEEGEQLGEGMNEHLKSRFLPWMEAHRRITTYAGATCHEVTPQGMIVTTKEGKRMTLEADTVMVIEKAKKNFDLYDTLKGRVAELYVIGDAKENRTAWIHEAVHDGARTALSL